MDEGIWLFTDTHQELTYNMRLPGQLCRISNVLPLTAAVRKQGLLIQHQYSCLPRRSQANWYVVRARPIFLPTYFYVYSYGTSTARQKGKSLTWPYCSPAYTR